MNNLDELTDEWLAKHDPYYKSSKKNKRKSAEYTYETARQEVFRKRKEVAFSSLSKQNLYKVADKNVDITGYLT